MIFIHSSVPNICVWTRLHLAKDWIIIKALTIPRVSGQVLVTEESYHSE